MVIGLIAKEIIKTAFRGAGKYYNIESQAFNKLYTGFPRSRLIGRGIRHGLTGGSIAGTFISKDADDSPGNGIQKRIQRQKSPSSKSYQTRSGRSSGYRARCRREPYSSSKYRYSRTSKY